MKHIQTFEAFLNESQLGFINTKFNSHRDHNPECDILEGHINGDTFITYGIYVNGPKIGEEFMEMYTGSNYKPDSQKKSNSRHYKGSDVPQKYLAKWQELKAIYENKYKNK